MALCSANFEKGTNGNTIATGDAGSVSAWDTVQIGAGAALVYDNAHAYGNMAAKFTQANPVVQVTLRWQAKFGTQTDHYGGFLFYATANPASSHHIWTAMSSTTIASRIYFRDDGKLSAADAAGVVQGTTTNAITLNQYVRIEYRSIHSVTVGQIEIKLFNSPNSTTPTETLTTAANFSTLASVDNVRFGYHATGPVGIVNWYDNMVAGASSYPGPWVDPRLSPMVIPPAAQQRAANW